MSSSRLSKKTTNCLSNVQFNEKLVFCQKEKHSHKIKHQAIRLDDGDTHPITISWE